MSVIGYNPTDVLLSSSNDQRLISTMSCPSSTHTNPTEQLLISQSPKTSTTVYTDDPILSAALNLSSNPNEGEDCVESILAALDKEAPTLGPFAISDVEQLCKDMASPSWNTSRRNRRKASASPPRRIHTSISDSTSSSRLRRVMKSCYDENGNWAYNEDCAVADILTSVGPDRQREEMKKRLPGRKWSDVCKRFRFLCGEVQHHDKNQHTIQKRLPCGSIITIPAPNNFKQSPTIEDDEVIIEEVSMDEIERELELKQQQQQQQQQQRKFSFWKPRRTTEGKFRTDFRIGKRMCKFSR